MTKNIIIAAQLVLLVWFGSAIVRLENYHYASMLQMCGEFDPLRVDEREKCLFSKQTRTKSHLSSTVRVAGPMSTYTAIIRWSREGAEGFAKGQYSRAHEWAFDGGA